MAKPLLGLEQPGHWFLGAVCLAASVRLYLLWQYYCINSDGVIYLRTARDFYSGQLSAGLGSIYPPGYPLLVAAVYPLFGNWELSGEALSWLFGVLLLFPLYWIFSEVFNSKIALLGCFLAAVCPFLARYSVQVRSESIYIFFSTLALYLFLTGIERQWHGRFFWGGLIVGYAYLIRPEAIGFLVIVPGIVLWRWLSLRRKMFARLVPVFGSFIVGFLLCSVPYIVYLSVDTGHLGAISRKAGITLAINLKESGVLEEEDAHQDDQLESFVFIDYVLQHRFTYLRQVTADLIPALGRFFDALYYSYVPFLILGIYVAWQNKFWRKPEFLLFGFVLFYVFGFALIYVKRRYALQAVPVSLGWVAMGMVYVWDSLRTLLGNRKAALVYAGLATIFLRVTLPQTFKPVSREKAYVRETGQYLKTRNGAGDLKVAVFDDRVSFYADAATVPLVEIREPELPASLRRRGAEYLAAESNAFHRAYPKIAEDPVQYGLILEKIFIGSRKDRMLLFRVS